MAATQVIDFDSMNWEELEAEVGTTGRKSTGMVANIEKACTQIMSKGGEYTVAKLTAMMDLGFNQGIEEGEDRIQVNWITVKYVLTHKSGFKAVDGKDNTFMYDAGVKRVQGKRKLTSKRS